MVNPEEKYLPPYQAESAEQIWDDTYSTKSFDPKFEHRRKALFEQVLRNQNIGRKSKRIIVEVIRLTAGGQPDEQIIHDSITEFIEGRNDCADFVMQAVIRILHQFNEGSEIRFSDQLLQHAKEAVLGFKYWPDEPGQDAMCTWTENHQILFTTSAFLVGQFYPDDVFTNSGRTGREMMEIHRPRIERWLKMRFKSGFSEWLSNVYYDEDWTALLNLVDFANDPGIKTRARSVLDLSLFDFALNSFQGVFGSTHGRSYHQNTRWASLEGTTDSGKLLFGTGVYSGFELFSAAIFAISKNYRLPEVLFEIANNESTFVNRQRMGHRTEDAARWGLGYDDLESAMVFFSNADFLHPKNTALTIKTFDAFNWWEHEFHEDFRSFRRTFTLLNKVKILPIVARILEKDISRNVRDEVNIYTYKTADYMLSTAQDYRPGYGGNQHHIWQATLGPNAICFTTSPANERRIGSSPNYWTGSSSLPRAAQINNVAIVIYKVSSNPFMTVPNKLSFTHAWFPRDQFDEVHEQNSWVFARKGDGYLALRSMKPYRWQNEPGEDQGREIIAEGEKNIWICELGRRETDGDFSKFIEKISTAEIQFRGLSVRYRSPSQGMLDFGWKKPLTVDGQIIKIEHYPRYGNPYCRADFWADEIVIQHKNKSLKLNWETGERAVAEL